ncbi:hypothetical protein DFH09DRAFT_1178067 [Mycena vulgaris]|nr:hypothetical protein DFH09DRAFT_1178067 [Mycena vulgaris]
MENFFHRLPFRKIRHSAAKNVNKEDDRTHISEQQLATQAQSPPEELPKRPHTTRNVLKVAVKTFSSVSSNIPFGLILSGVIDPLLDITDRIEQVSANTQGLIELAARIDRLTTIVSDMAVDKPEKGRAIVEALGRESQSITKDLNDARSQGKLEQFFNSADTASSLAAHNMKLAQMIADATLVPVQEVLKSLRDLERSTILESPSSASQGHFEMGDIRGGLGSARGSARIGGEGGEGKGPKVEMSPEEHWKMGNIYGGTGGTGEEGVEVGGKRGTSKAPVIRVLRTAPAVTPNKEIY